MDLLLENLLEMGFDKMKAEAALKATNGLGIAEAMDWLIAHQDDAGSSSNFTSAIDQSVIPDQKKSDDGLETSSIEAQEQIQIPKSYKCDDCGRQLKNDQELEFHASKTGHVKFSESTETVKPLTEEEKKQKATELKARLKQKRELKEAEERKEAILLEKSRRLTGQELADAKMRMQEIEMKKIAEERKRQKKEDIAAKKRILDQIKRDKEDKKQLFVNESKASSNAMPDLPIDQNIHTAPVDSARPSYDQCKIQIRMLNGKCLIHEFGSKEPLSAVRLYVEMNRTDDSSIPFNLITTVPPRRQFDDNDMQASLEGLGLAPSAVLTMTRKA